MINKNGYLLRVSTYPNETTKSAQALDPTKLDTPGYSSAFQTLPIIRDEDSGEVRPTAPLNLMTVMAAALTGDTSFSIRSGEPGVPIYVKAAPKSVVNARYGTIETPDVPGQPTKDSDDINMFLSFRDDAIVNKALMHPDNQMSKREATYNTEGTDVIRDELGNEIGGEQNVEVRVPYEEIDKFQSIATFYPASQELHYDFTPIGQSEKGITSIRDFFD